MPATRRTNPARRALTASLCCAALLVVTGCSDGTSADAPPEPPPASTIAELDLEAATLARRDPCAGIDPGVRMEVVGDGPEGASRWEPGQTLPDSTQIADEFGCQISGSDATARAWVFAPPVTPREARTLAKEATSGNCREADGPSFGRPAVAFRCDLTSGESLHGMRGLVGTTWLACEVQGRSDPSRAERWCVAVLGSLED